MRLKVYNSWIWYKFNYTIHLFTYSVYLLYIYTSIRWYLSLLEKISTSNISIYVKKIYVRTSLPNKLLIKSKSQTIHLNHQQILTIHQRIEKKQKKKVISDLISFSQVKVGYSHYREKWTKNFYFSIKLNVKCVPLELVPSKSVSLIE